MGNRAQIEVIGRRGGRGKATKSTWLYSHAQGCFVPWVVKWALESVRGKWGDADAIVTRLTRKSGDRWTGDPLPFRVEEGPFWVQHLNTVVDVPAQRIRFVDYPGSNEVSADWTFEEFLQLSRQEIDLVFHEGYGLTREGISELERILEALERVPNGRRRRKRLITSEAAAWVC